MAYSLRFNGVNDRVLLSSEISLQAGDAVSFTVSSFIGTEGQNRYLMDSGALTRAFVLVRSDGTMRFNTSVISSLLIDGSAATDQVTVFPTDGLDHEIVINISSSCGMSRVGSAQNYLERWNADIKRITVSRNSSLIHDYLKESLVGSNDTTWNDRVGSNNGNLFNFPTDNSQWVFYSAPSAGVDADINYTVNTPTFASSASATLPQPIADTSITINAPDFSALASATLPNPISNLSVTINSPVFAVTGGASLPQPIVDASFTVNVPAVNGNASATIPGFSASVSFTVSTPTASSSASVTLPNPSANVSYAVSAPTFSVNADASLPQPTSDLAFTVNAPTVAASATATETGFNASVNFTVNAPTFAVDASATLPQPDSSVNFAVSTPIVSVVAIVGGIAIIVDEETNINQRVLSNNINAPILSNNING